MTTMVSSVICPLCRTLERGVDPETNQPRACCDWCARKCGNRKHTHRYGPDPANSMTTNQPMVPVFEHGKHVGFRCAGHTPCDYVERTDGRRDTGPASPLVVTVDPAHWLAFALAVSLAADTHDLTADLAVALVGIVYSRGLSGEQRVTDVIRLVHAAAPAVDAAAVTTEVAAVFGYREG